MSKLGLLEHAFIKTEQGGMSAAYMGGAWILDPTSSPYLLDAAMLADHLAAVMEEVPLMRQKLVQDKLRVGNMRLVDDPDFDVNNHISVVHLDEPAGYDELTEYLGRFSMRRMDLGRPLWHFEVIEGLENGYIAMAMHLHHSILDGVGASRTLAGIWSEKPVPARTPRADAWRADPEPGAMGMLADAITENVKRLYVDTPTFVLNNTRPVLQTLTRELDKRLGAQKDSEAEVRNSLPAVQKTSLNVGRLSNRRVVAYLELPLADIKSLRKAHDCTINDLALFINSCALEHYFKAIGEKVDFDLICSMPLSTRKEGDNSTGNSVAMARVNLHNTIGDAKKRLAAIVEDTREIKRNAGRARKDGAGDPRFDLGAFSDLFSPILLEALVYGVTQFKLLEKVPPMLNVAITNVPGSPAPMYIAGARAVSIVPMAPCGDLMGLTITVTSTESQLVIGYHGCGEAIKDKELLVKGARLGMALLQPKPKRKARAKTNTAAKTRRKSAAPKKTTRQ